MGTKANKVSALLLPCRKNSLIISPPIFAFRNGHRELDANALISERHSTTGESLRPSYRRLFCIALWNSDSSAGLRSEIAAKSKPDCVQAHDVITIAGLGRAFGFGGRPYEKVDGMAAALINKRRNYPSV